MNTTSTMTGRTPSAPASTNRQTNLIEGRRRKDSGIALAATRKQLEVWRGQLAFLQAIRANPEREATTDECVTDLAAEFPDGGCWRGEITKGLSRIQLIERVGYRDSARPSRHSAPIGIWRGVDDSLIDGFITHLEAIIPAAEAALPPEAKEEQPELFPEPTAHDDTPLGEVLPNAIKDVLSNVINPSPVTEGVNS